MRMQPKYIFTGGKSTRPDSDGRCHCHYPGSAFISEASASLAPRLER